MLFSTVPAIPIPATSDIRLPKAAAASVEIPRERKLLF